MNSSSARGFVVPLCGASPTPLSPRAQYYNMFLLYCIVSRLLRAPRLSKSAESERGLTAACMKKAQTNRPPQSDPSHNQPASSMANDDTEQAAAENVAAASMAALPPVAVDSEILPP